MKIELEDHDKEYIERLRNDIEAGEAIPGIFLKGRYSISFDIIDEAKANCFLHNMIFQTMYDKRNDIEDLLGVKFTSVNFTNTDPAITNLKEYLKQVLEYLDNM